MEFALPHIGEGVKEAELVRWLVRPGDVVRRGQTLLEVMTDKATMEIPSPFAGGITATKGQPGEMLQVGQIILDYASADASVAEPRVSTTVRQSVAAVSNGPVPVRAPLSVRAAPSVRQMARKLGINLADVPGSGPDGRVLIEDLTHFVRPAALGRDATRKSGGVRFEFGQPGTRLKLQGLRRRIAEHMTRSKQTVPHAAYVDECDVTELVKLRDSLKEVYARAGVKLTYLAFIVKAVTAALKEMPILNASLAEEDGEIVLHDRYNIGVATATPGGLIVPVVRDADKKSVGDIAREIERLSEEARNNKSRLEDLRGGTFTVTSVGNIGGLFSTPVINHPEAAILGIGKITRRPVYDDAGQVRPADIVYLSLSFDHRIIDGAVAAVFCNAIIQRLSHPVELLLPEKL